MNALAHSGAALAALAAAPILGAGAALRPAWREGWRERLGAAPRFARAPIWLHVASVGELHAALPLADALERRGDGVLVSTFTPSARRLLARERPGRAATLAPLDHPWCAGRALARVRPRALVLVETELWPAWIRSAERTGVPVAVVSGRISDRSFARYAKLARYFGPTFARISAVGARSVVDRERFLALGAHPDRVVVTGDLKSHAGAAPEPASDLREALGPAPWIVFGSTHPGEEALLLDALGLAPELADVGVVLAPRHLRRAPEVLELCRERGRAVSLRSRLSGQPLAPGGVLVLDSFGELAGLYALARVAVIGGTFAPVGGHNPLEASRFGVPVLHGPSTEGMREAYASLPAARAAREVADAPALSAALVALLRDAGAAKKPMPDASGTASDVVARTAALIGRVARRAHR
jgi:3-deoxy-D-manno-octulosonic-acid transferase